MARANSKMQLVMTSNEGVYTATMTFGNGEVRTFEIGGDHPLFTRFAVHGVEQKLRDRIAASENVEEAVSDVDELLAAFGENNWNCRSSGEPRDTSGLLVRALVVLTGKTQEEVKAIVGGMDKKQQAALRADEAVAAEIAKLREPPKAPKGVDIGAFKASLGF